MRTIRILSLDGGGIRGISSARFLELFCTAAGFTPTELWKHFDCIAGTSIGGISALAYANGMSPMAIKDLLITNGPSIFDINTAGIHGQASYGTWLGYLSGTFASLYYSAPLISLVTDTLGGTLKLSDLKTKVIIPSFQTKAGSNDSQVPTFFSNIAPSVINIFSGANELAKNVALATSAAPVYFPPYSFGGNTYVDGGIYYNQPLSLALSAMKALNPATNRFCVISIGTGIENIGYIKPSNDREPSSHELKGISENLGAIKLVMDASMALPPEVIAKEYDILANQTLENLYYYRFQFQIDRATHPNSALDNASPEFMTYLQTAAETQFTVDQEKISTFIGHLVA